MSSGGTDLQFWKKIVKVTQLCLRVYTKEFSSLALSENALALPLSAWDIELRQEEPLCQTMDTAGLTCAQLEVGTCWPRAGGAVLGCAAREGNSFRSVQVASGQGKLIWLPACPQQALHMRVLTSCPV